MRQKYPDEFCLVLCLFGNYTDIFNRKPDKRCIILDTNINCV